MYVVWVMLYPPIGSGQGGVNIFLVFGVWKVFFFIYTVKVSCSFMIIEMHSLEA